MKKRYYNSQALYFFCGLFFLFCGTNGFSQNANDSASLTVRSIPAGGNIYMFDCENGFGGGNVAASIGPDGILLVDDMFKSTVPKLLEALKKRSSAPIRFVINTHSHRDHIEGNILLSGSSTIIAQENELKRFRARPGAAPEAAVPQLVFTDSLLLRFNGEDIRLIHLPNGHTDNDVYVWFTRSGVIHMGDTYFNGMFPAVYKESGGDILQMIANLEKIVAILPDDIKVIPGHGDLASKKNLLDYIAMLKETTGIVRAAIGSGKTLEQLQQQKAFVKYDILGKGGAQTTEQYTAMLFKLLSL